MKPQVLVIGGLVVGGAALLLWLKLRDPAVAGATQNPGKGSSGATTVATDHPQDPSNPALPTPGSGTPVAWGSGSNATYDMGGVTIRDHRTGNRPPMDLPPNLHPPDGRKVSSVLVQEISEKFKVVMRECTKDVPKEARGEKPRVEGVIAIKIANHAVSISSATVQLREIIGASLEPAKQCLEAKALELTHTAPDEADVTDYQIHLSFVVL